MPRSHGDRPPATYIIEGPWPHATLHPDAPVSAHYAQHLARRLAAAMASRPISNRALAELAGVSHPTIGRVLNGETLPDLGTLARLEVALATTLYPAGLHRTWTSVHPSVDDTGRHPTS